MNKLTLPKIAVSMGDPGGIGPEVALKALSMPRVRRICSPVLVGDFKYLQGLARDLGIRVMRDGETPVARRQAGLAVVQAGQMWRGVAPGRPSKGGGLAAGAAIERAVELALSGEVAGIVTAPVSKESLALAGYGMVGHTELLGELTGTREYAMMLVRKGLRVVFATTHVPVSRVGAVLNRADLVRKFALAAEFLRSGLGIARPRLGVCCLNPHCGEGGVLSHEERRVIIPAIRTGRRRRMCIEGPYPADSIFGRRLAPRFDAIVAMYHDQGMIPIKMDKQEEVVNITLGIPIVRTSPGHGTGFDIASKHIADERGMVAAITECVNIAKRTGYAR